MINIYLQLCDVSFGFIGKKIATKTWVFEYGYVCNQLHPKEKEGHTNL